ncbi:MAG: FmdB family zinc ribbon protein [Myxococcota bacterium]
MPIYDYRCEACGHEFEDLRSFSDPDPEACPECGEDAVRKLITGGNFQLKGSGWYVTDYGGKKVDEPTATDKSSSREGRDSGSESSSASDSGSSGDSGGEAA